MSATARFVPAATRAKRSNAWVFNGALIALSAVIFLSPYGTRILSLGGGYIPEAGIIPVLALLCVFRPTAFAEICKTAASRPMLKITAVLLLLFIVGSLTFNDAIGPYTDFRACYVLCFCFSFFCFAEGNKEQKLTVLMWLCIFCIPAGFLAGLHDDSSSADSDSAKNIFNIFAIVILCHIASRQRSPLPIIAAIAVIIVAAIMSGYRTHWIVASLTIISYLTYFLIMRFRSREGLKAAGTIAAILVAGIVVLQSGIIVQYLSANQARYIQSIGKAQDLIDSITSGQSSSESDEIHRGYYICAYEYAEDFILPHGLGAKSAFGRVHRYFNRFTTPANTQDCGIFYMIYHGGYVITALTLIAFFLLVRNRLRMRQLGVRRFSICVGLVACVVYLSASGNPFTVISIAAMFGSYLGVLLNPTICPDVVAQVAPSNIAGRGNMPFGLRKLV